MVGARPKQYRTGESHWIFTPIALSLLVHAILLGIVPELRIFKVGVLRKQLRETFHISETRRVIPTTVESVSSEFEPAVPEQPATLNGDQISLPALDTSAVLVQPEKPTSVDDAVRMPLKELETLNPVPAEAVPLPGNSLVDDGESLQIMGLRPVFIGKHRSVGPGPSVSLGVSPVSALKRSQTSVPAAPRSYARSGSAKAASHAWLPPVHSPESSRIEDSSLPAIAADLLRIEPSVPREPLHEVNALFEMYREPNESRAYFRLTLALRPDAQMDVIAKDVLIVIDVSRSISKIELRETQKAVSVALRELNRGDRFNVALFSEDIKTLFPSFVEPSPERIRQVESFIVRRGRELRTNVYRMTQTIIGDLPKNHRPISIFLISDGVSTQGIDDARQIIRDFGRVVGDHISVFTFNAGSPSNPYLLDLLAYRSRGIFVTTPNERDSSGRFAELHLEVDRPILVNLQANYGNLSVDDTYPQALPNLYVDRPVVIYGRCRPREEFAFRLIGSAAHTKKEFWYHRIVPTEYTRDRSIAREWARRKVHFLVANIALEGQRPEYVQEIKRLGKEYDIPTLYDR